MIKTKSMFVLQMVSIAFMLCLLAQTAPLFVLGAATKDVAVQEAVTKDSGFYDTVVEFTGDSHHSKSDDKITANGAKYDIKLDGKTVGHFVFNKHEKYIEVIIEDSVAVDVMWSCSEEYAKCTLNGEGKYEIPQLVDVHGKVHNFDAIWVSNVVERCTFEDFCSQYAMYASNGNAGEYKQVYDIMISAGLTKGVPTDIPVASEPSYAIVPTADGGWALQTTELNEGVSDGTPTTRANYYWTSVVSSPPTQWGWVDNPGYALGSPDGVCAGLHTVGCDISTNFAGEAILNGAFGRICTGPIEVWARSLGSGDNYFVVQYQLNNGPWTPLGTGQVTSSSILKFTFPTGAQFDRVSVTCCTMLPPYPPGSHMLINHVGIDAVGAY